MESNKPIGIKIAEMDEKSSPKPYQEAKLTNVEIVKLELAEYIMAEIKTLIKITIRYTESVDIPYAFAVIFRSAEV